MGASAPEAPDPATDKAVANCQGEVSRELPVLTDDLGSRLAAEAEARVGKDSRVLAATANWRDCMKGAGFQVTDPGSLVSHTPGAATPPPAEVAMARADVGCTGRANLAGVWFGVLYGYQQELVDRNGPALAQLRKEIADRDVKNARILAGSAG